MSWWDDLPALKERNRLMRAHTQSINAYFDALEAVKAHRASLDNITLPDTRGWLQRLVEFIGNGCR